jgi:tetratricopeptide (TPR) repeat protein
MITKTTTHNLLLLKFTIFNVIGLCLTSCGSSNQEQTKQQQVGDTITTLTKIDNQQPTTNINYLAECKNYYNQAKKFDSLLLKEIDLNPKLANDAIKAFTDYAFYCHNDSLSPIFLIKTAQVAKAVNNYPQAKIVLDKCIADYPNFKNRAAALFLLAQIYDEPGILNSESEAQKLYEKIIAEHPKSDWAKSAKGALTFIGKSDAQIMQELKNKK